MKIVVAPDSFKGSLSSRELCTVIATALSRRLPSVQIVCLPIADGGEGTCEALICATGGRYISRSVSGPMGEIIHAEYGILGDDRTAVIEMAAASGLPLVPRHKRNPWVASSYGTGQLIIDALNKGCRRIIMGIGGSATNDGGSGMLTACGASFLGEDGPILPGCKGLLSLKRIDISGMDKRLAKTEFIVACDVTNPLCGENGATAIFGPQKGVAPWDIAQMDYALSNFAAIMEQDLGKKTADLPGAGAAGGMGAGLMGFFGAKLTSGFKLISTIIGLEQALEGASLVITGEGQMNGQSVMGKVPVEVAKLSAQYGAKTIAIVGAIVHGGQEATGYFDAVHQLMEPHMTVDYSVKNTEKLLIKKLNDIALPL